MSTERVEAGALSSTGLARVRLGLPTVLVLVLLVVGWGVAVVATGVNELAVPGPVAVAQALGDNVGDLTTNTLVTVQEAALGFVLGNVAAIACAVAFVHSDLLRTTAYPVLLVVQAIPLVAIAPILGVWLGAGLAPKVLLAAFLAYTVTLVNMVKGLTSPDTETIELLHTLGAGRWQVLRTVRFPASTPFFFTSLKLGASGAMVAAIAAEYIGALSGLGHLLQFARMRLDTPYLWAVVVVCGVVGIVAYGLMALVEKIVVRWQPPAVDEV